MQTMNANPYRAYRQTQVRTASGMDLILLLYNGAIKFLKQAVKALEKRELESAHHALIRAQDIISELSVSLNHDVGGEISHSLEQLYDYMNWRLVQANVRKDIEPVTEVINMLEELRDTWAEVSKGQGAKGRSPESAGLNIAK